jgi:hypothetical protein
MTLAFNPTPINWQMLAGIGENIGNKLKERKLTNAMQGWDGQNTMDLYNRLISAGQPELAIKVFNQQSEADALAGYRKESLKPDVVRQYEYMYGGAPSAPKIGGDEGPPQNANNVPTLAEFGQSLKPTPAQGAVDKEFGKDYASWVASGGSANVEKSLDQLYGSLGNLAERDDVSGPIVGNLNDTIRSWVAPESIKTQQDIEEPIQTNLRAVLGSQYTQQEGENLLRRTYDPRLEESVNIGRVKRVITQLKTMARAKEAAARYYEANGTLRGYKGRMPTLEDVRALSPEGKNTERLAPEAAPGVEAAPAQAGASEVKYGNPGLPMDEGPYAEVGPRPTPEDMSLLNKNAADPEFRAAFEQIYGAGAVDRWLGNKGWTTR